MLNVASDGASDIGRQRERNEDAFVLDDVHHIYLVADGMGGHNAGHVASAEAAAEARRFLRTRLEELEPESAEPDAPTEREELIAVVRASVQKACAHVYNLAQQDAELTGMGCTMTVLVMVGSRGYVGHVGDCRLWLVRDGEAHQMTEDHRVVTELVRKGELTEEEAKDFPFPNSLSRSVGVHPMVSVDTLDFDLMEGDRFLLCSDGLHEYLGDDEVSTLVWSADEVGGLPARLVDRANADGGRDNITAVCLEVKSVGGGTQVSVDTLNMMAYIRRIPMLVELDYRELTAFLNHSTQLDFQAGDEIFSQGSPGGYLQVLLYGRVQVLRDGRMLGEIAAGEPIGETSFLDSLPHSASVQALEVSRTLRLPSDELRELFQSDPRLGTKLMTGLARSLAARLRG